ncbi:MAG: serine protease [Deltaproteobacteria bacterium]|nr:serine protease [Deltaproteobacteria bacterium]
MTPPRKLLVSGLVFLPWLVIFQATLIFAQASSVLAQTTQPQTGQAPTRVEEPRGVVSLRVTNQAFDPRAPWQKQNEDTIQGSALVIRKGWLLTTAEMVRNATLIEAGKLGRTPSTPVRLVRVDYELDLALLRVDSPDFWKDLEALPLAPQALSGGRFLINRWRSTGRFEQGTGEVVDVRAGTSRYGNMEIPQLRANTNMGGLGWAEVLTLDGQVVGIITSQNQEIQVTPSPVLAAFVAAADHPGWFFAHRGFTWQRTDHPALAQALGLRPGGPGVLIPEVLSGGTGAREIRPGDVLLVVNGYLINNEGQIQHPLYGRVAFTLALNDLPSAKTLPAKVWRNGNVVDINLVRRRYRDADYRVLPYAFDGPADYEVLGGVVFQELQLDALRAWGKGWTQRAPQRLIIEYALNSMAEGNHPEKIVIISQVFPDPSTLGYESSANSMVVRVNGRAVTSLASLRQALKSPLEGFHVVETMGGGRGSLVLKADEIPTIRERVGKLYGLPNSIPVPTKPAPKKPVPTKP